MAGRKKLQLPKSVLEMKFMKKTKDRLDKELENTLGHEVYSNIISDEMRHASGNYISESSFFFCEDLIDGRLSFKGMNPELEKLMESENPQNNCEGEMQKDISDEVLANKMSRFNKRKGPADSSKHNVPKKKKH